MQTKVLRIHNKDNVAVALTVLYKGEQVSSESFTAIELQENIPAKHKFALQDFNINDEINILEEDIAVEDLYEDEAKIFPNVDGIKFLKHTLGCGGTRDDARALCGLLAGYIIHANVAGTTVLSLGCQNAQVALLKEEIE